MVAANLPGNEQDRLNNLYSYELLNTLPEKDYDDITKLASYICGAPVSLITIIDADRQWFKSKYGVDVQETSREHAFCSHAILRPDEIMIVPDMKKDIRFYDNPLVTGDYNVMFYAGVPLLSEEGYPLGSLCILDTKPNNLDENQKQALKMLANQAMRLIELHKKTKQLMHNRQLMLEVNKELENFAQVTAENLKMPCNNAIEFTDMIGEKFADVLDADGKQLLSLIKYSCESIKDTVDNTLERANRINLLQDTKTLFTFNSLMQELKQQLSSPLHIVLSNSPENDNIYFFRKLLLQIIASIITTSSQFNDKENQVVEITYLKKREHYIFTISDNGKGIPVFSRNGEFALLQASGNENEDNFYTDNLNAVKEIILSLSGSLEMNFDENKGTVFIINLQK